MAPHGIANVVELIPPPEVVVGVATVMPSNLIVAVAVFAKPEPVRLTLFPDDALAVTLMLAVSTVYVADALWPPAVIWTDLPPVVAPDGTTYVAPVKLPAASV